MNKLAIPFVIVLVIIVLAFVAYGNGAANEQPKAPIAQTMATESMVVPANKGEAVHAAHQEDHTASEAVHGNEGHAPADPMAGTHGVPAESAAVENPISVSDESINQGAIIFRQSCAVCHGDTGKGDGPGAAGLNPKPADLHADHVQGNSDGAMFWIISYGRDGTAMPPWNTLLREEQRWDVVNFLRTFREK